MSQTYGGGFITVTTTGVTQPTGATSTSFAIPNASDGNPPRFIRVSATKDAFFKLGTSGVVATTSDIMTQPADAVIIAVPRGITHIAHIQGSASSNMNVVALENI